MDKYILGLDPSTKSTGYSIFKNSELVDHGIITAEGTNLYKRIDKIIAGLNEVLQKYSINECIIEDIQREDVHGNDNTFKPLMYLQGFICHLLNKYNIKPFFYFANEWRKRCGIKTGPGVKRDSLKPKDIDFVKRMYNLTMGDDEADAICIGYAYTHEPIPVQDEEIQIIDGFEFK